MMKVLLSPVCSDRVVEYKFGSDKIQAIENGVSYLYDFTNLEDGILNDPTNHIARANRVNGVLSVELINPIPSNAEDGRKFPSWIDITTPTTVTGTTVNLSWLNTADITPVIPTPTDSDRITALEEAILLLMMEG